MAYMGTEREATVPAAELAGIILALRLARDHPLLCGPLEVYTDNQGALRNLSSPGLGSGQYLVREIIELLAERRRVYGGSGEVAFYWIPAHLDVPGNEMADEAAKRATGWRKQGPPGPPAARLPDARPLRSAAGAWIKEYTKEEWRNNWRHAAHGGHLRQYLPELDPRSKAVQRYEGLSAPQASALFQARTGKIGLNRFLATIRKTEDPLCPCGQADETVAHVLLRCTRYDRLRRKLWGPDYTAHPQHVKDALTDLRHALKSAQLLIATGRLPYLREMARLRVTEQGEVEEVPEDQGAEEQPYGDSGGAEE